RNVDADRHRPRLSPISGSVKVDVPEGFRITDPVEPPAKRAGGWIGGQRRKSAATGVGDHYRDGERLTAVLGCQGPTASGLEPYRTIGTWRLVVDEGRDQSAVREEDRRHRVAVKVAREDVRGLVKVSSSIVRPHDEHGISKLARRGFLEILAGEDVEAAIAR